MKKLTFAIIALLGMGFGASAQTEAGQKITITVPQVAKLAIALSGNSNGSIGADQQAIFGQPANAGEAVSNAAAINGVFLNYSSIVASATAFNKVTVGFAGIPAGVKITVAATAPSAGAQTGAGNQGMGASADFESTTTASASIISNIGSCYTGVGNQQGTSVSYSFSTVASTYGSLYATTGTDATATYTILAQ